MPTSYLTPGVYVEEIPAAQKPLEGVSTSVAAFVGLAPGGPVNTPMRIANWSQFARIFGDPSNPDAGPFMEDAYLAHSVYGFFQNGGTLCWVIRIGADADAAAPHDRRRAAGRRRHERRDAARRGAPGRRGPRHGRRSSRRRAPATTSGDDKTYRIVVQAGDAEGGVRRALDEGPLEPPHEGQRRLQAHQDRGDGRLAAGGAARAEARQVRARGRRPRRPKDLSSGDFEGDAARRQGMGGLVAIDEVSIVCMPDAVTLLNGDDVMFRDAQGKMITHCESLGDRMCILDTPPDLIPQDVLEWRKDTAGYDSKMAALYWPWLEVIDPLSKRPIMVPPSGHVAGLWARTDDTARRSQGARQRGRHGRDVARLPADVRRAGRAQPARDQLHPRVQRARDPGVGRAHAVQRSGVALHQRAPAVQLRLADAHGGHAVVGVRAQRRAPVAEAARVGVATS